MRKNLIAALVTLSLGGAAAAAIIASTALAQAPAPRAPMQLAQTAPSLERGRGARGMRTPPTAAERSARRAELCQDGYARAAGRFATLEVRLNLSGAQSAAFARWRDLRLAAAKSRASECASRPQPAQMGPRGANAAPPSPVERLTRQETLLQRRLAEIQAERPALDALYTSLNPEQRQILARSDRGGFGRGGRRGGMGMAGRRGGMMFRRDGMGGPQGRPGMAPPPPPPPQ